MIAFKARIVGLERRTSAIGRDTISHSGAATMTWRMPLPARQCSPNSARKFLGFSFTAAPDIKRTIAPKSRERFKRREVTRRARQHQDDNGRTGPVYAGLVRLFRLLRNARGVDRSHSLGPTAIAGRSVASVENTTSPPRSADRTASLRGTAQYGRKRPWPLEHRTEQSPLCWAFKRLLQIARSPNLGRNALAQLLEPPCTDPYARWCGRGGAERLPPIPITGPNADLGQDIAVHPAILVPDAGNSGSGQA